MKFKDREIYEGEKAKEHICNTYSCISVQPRSQNAVELLFCHVSNRVDMNFITY
jgi:hypothetical protein